MNQSSRNTLVTSCYGNINTIYTCTCATFDIQEYRFELFTLMVLAKPLLDLHAHVHATHATGHGCRRSFHVDVHTAIYT